MAYELTKEEFGQFCKRKGS